MTSAAEVLHIVASSITRQPCKTPALVIQSHPILTLEPATTSWHSDGTEEVTSWMTSYTRVREVFVSTMFGKRVLNDRREMTKKPPWNVSDDFVKPIVDHSINARLTIPIYNLSTDEAGVNLALTLLRCYGATSWDSPRGMNAMTQPPPSPALSNTSPQHPSVAW